MSCPAANHCIREIESCNNTEESSPPPPPALDGNWELQFCKWWGWTWAQKHDRQSVGVAYPSEAGSQPHLPEDPPPNAAGKKKKKGGGIFGCFKKKEEPPRKKTRQNARFSDSREDMSEHGGRGGGGGGECCMCCPCMQPPMYTCCPCMMQQQNYGFGGGGFVESAPMDTKQVQCNVSCVNADTQTKQRLAQLGCNCNGPIYPPKNVDVQVTGCRRVQDQATAVSRTQMKQRARQCTCARKCQLMRQLRPPPMMMCCGGNRCCPCPTNPRLMQNQQVPPNPPPETNATDTTTEVIANWCKLSTSPLDQKIRDNLNILSLLGPEKYLKIERNFDNDSNETINFLNGSDKSKDHRRILTKVCDAILSSSPNGGGSNASSNAHIPTTIFSDKSLHNVLKKNEPPPPPPRKISITNSNLAKVETIDELIAAMDLSMKNEVFDRIDAKLQ